LTAALNDAEPGDHIVLANGTYSSNRTISPNGTATNPIVIRAQFAHQAIVTGVWTVTGDDVTIYQLKFQGAAKVNWSNALRTRFLRNHVDVSTTLWTMSGASHDSEIAYNQWTTSNTSDTDRLVDIRLSSGNVQRAWVHHNYFVNLATDKCFGIGNQRSHTSINTDLLFEYNLAHNCQGTLLYVKCSRIVARFNTRSGTGGGGGYVVNLRHGKNSKVIANVAIQNSYGPVARGDNHEFIGNYYDNARGHSKTFGGGGGAATGDCTEDQFAAGTGARPRAFNCQFIGNIGNLWIGYDSLSNT
jgi:poly(beta-D-mannuronate) lyase